MLRKANVKNRSPKPPDQTWTVVGRLDESLRSFKRFGSPGSSLGLGARTKTKSGLENPKVARVRGSAGALDWDCRSRWPGEGQVAGPLGP